MKLVVSMFISLLQTVQIYSRCGLGDYPKLRPKPVLLFTYSVSVFSSQIKGSPTKDHATQSHPNPSHSQQASGDKDINVFPYEFPIPDPNNGEEGSQSITLNIR